MHESIDRIGALLAAGHATAVIELTEYALARVDQAMSTLDDSSGWFSQVVSELERLHYEACVVAKPEPIALARRLFAIDVDGEWDILIDSVERYADVLGDDGIAEMRRLAEERWAEMPGLRHHTRPVPPRADDGRCDAGLLRPVCPCTGPRGRDGT